MEPWIDAAHLAFILAGVLSFAISGALLATSKQMDLVGVAALATSTALGGGMIRDLLIGSPIAALSDPWLFPTALLGAAVVVITQRRGRIPRRTVLIFDALGLGVFCVESAVKGVTFALNPYAAALVGMITGVGGGVIRDVLANEIPSVFRSGSGLYVIPALVGGLAAALLWSTGLGSAVLLSAVAVAVTLVRLASLRFRWEARLPQPRGSRDTSA